MLDIKRYVNTSKGKLSSKIGQNTPFVRNEISESDSEEYFQDGIPLRSRTEIHYIHEMFEEVGIKGYGHIIQAEKSENVNYNNGQDLLHENNESDSDVEFQEGIPLIR